MTSITIFYVDDDEDDLALFEIAADEIGQKVVLFNLGDDLLKAMRNPPPMPSVIFVDLNMPIKNGYTIIQEIRESEAFGQLPIIVYSTASNSVTIEKCKELGATMYVTKQTSMQLLKKAIQDVLLIDWNTFQQTDANFIYRPLD